MEGENNGVKLINEETKFSGPFEKEKILFERDKENFFEKVKKILEKYEPNIDSITKLPNKNFFNISINKLSRVPVGIICLKIDSFGYLKQYFGTEAGNEILQFFSYLLFNFVNKYNLHTNDISGIPYYFGEDTFFVLIEGVDSEEEVKNLMEQLSSEFNNYIIKFNGGKLLDFDFSVGSSFYNPDQNLEKSIKESVKEAFKKRKIANDDRLDGFFTLPDNIKNNINNPISIVKITPSQRKEFLMEKKLYELRKHFHNLNRIRENFNINRDEINQLLAQFIIFIKGSIILNIDIKEDISDDAEKFLNKYGGDINDDIDEFKKHISEIVSLLEKFDSNNLDKLFDLDDLDDFKKLISQFKTIFININNDFDKIKKDFNTDSSKEIQIVIENFNNLVNKIETLEGVINLISGYFIELTRFLKIGPVNLDTIPNCEDAIKKLNNINIVPREDN